MGDIYIDYGKASKKALFIIASVVYEFVAFKYIIPEQTLSYIQQNPQAAEYPMSTYFINVLGYGILLWFVVMLILFASILFWNFLFEEM